MSWKWFGFVTVSQWKTRRKLGPLTKISTFPSSFLLLSFFFFFFSSLRLEGNWDFIITFLIARSSFMLHKIVDNREVFERSLDYSFRDFCCRRRILLLIATKIFYCPKKSSILLEHLLRNIFYDHFFPSWKLKVSFSHDKLY